MKKSKSKSHIEFKIYFNLDFKSIIEYYKRVDLQVYLVSNLILFSLYYSSFYINLYYILIIPLFFQYLLIDAIILNSLLTNKVYAYERLRIFSHTSGTKIRHYKDGKIANTETRIK
jgi:hypothetical protein